VRHEPDGIHQCGGDGMDLAVGEEQCSDDDVDLAVVEAIGEAVAWTRWWWRRRGVAWT
jgi:hypothetical protein